MSEEQELTQPPQPEPEPKRIRAGLVDKATGEIVRYLTDEEYESLEAVTRHVMIGPGQYMRRFDGVMFEGVHYETVVEYYPLVAESP